MNIRVSKTDGCVSVSGGLLGQGELVGKKDHQRKQDKCECFGRAARLKGTGRKNTRESKTDM